MKLFPVAAVLGLATPVFPQNQYALWYDTVYDQQENPLTSVACSNGDNGLINKGFNTFGQLPTFPYIGGTPQIESWDSPECGTCWSLTYINPAGQTSSIGVLVVNSAPQGGFSISLEAMNGLTNGNALEVDGASITATQLPAFYCGMDV